ncbi:GNAT family N-acetyltransferase [Actinoplanes sp. NPDC051470]|uniref:GNAT family N-acetyltransferase n=1 Tax=Actinoplanes sp. NPDC051470 TaxID=3157224 RepID=UPI0034261B09
MQIQAREALDPEVAALVTAQQRELAESGDEFVYPAPDVHYLVALIGGRAVACGGWQPLEEGVAELKRMFVRPSYRGQGIARALVVALEEEALAAGHTTVRLETGVYLTGAIALYRSAGYRPIPVYGEYVGNPLSVCFEKRLPALVQ